MSFQDVIASSGVALARMCKQLGWNDLALSLAVRTSRYAPESFDAAYYQARFLFEKGHHREALEEFHSVMQRWPDLIGGYDGYTRALQELGRHQDALGVIDQVLDRWSSNADMYVDQGVSLSALGRTSEAVAAYVTALRIDPDHPSAHFNLGLIRAEQQDWAEALEYLQRAYELSPSAGAALVLGEALLEEDRPKDAVALLHSALRRYPRDTNLRIRLGQALWDAGEHPKSVAVLRDVVRHDLNNTAALSMLSAGLVQTDFPSEALEIAERLVSIESSAPAYATRGFVHLHMRNGAAALQDFETAESLDASVIDYVAQRGCALSLLGRHREALAAFQQVLDVNPRRFAIDSTLQGYYDASKEAAHTRR